MSAPARPGEAAHPPARRPFRPDEHIRRRADFELGYRTGLKMNGRHMTVFVRANQLAVPRLGIAATRKIGGAVIRNRAKRVTRELFRHLKPAAGVDIIVIPRREFLDASFLTLEREFRSLLTRAERSVDTRTVRARPRAGGAGGDQGV